MDFRDREIFGILLILCLAKIELNNIESLGQVNDERDVDDSYNYAG